MFKLRPFVGAILLLFLSLPSFVCAVEPSAKPADLNELKKQYPVRDVDVMIKRLAAAGDERRVMIDLKKLQFDGVLMAAPKAGEYTLAYDSLKLFEYKPMPIVNHSAYIKTAAGKVIAVYLEEGVAKRLKKEKVGVKATFYALHIYNYENGPRFLILSYQAQ